MKKEQREAKEREGEVIIYRQMSHVSNSSSDDDGLSASSSDEESLEERAQHKDKNHQGQRVSGKPTTIIGKQALHKVHG